jgi:hypothetical protein
MSTGTNPLPPLFRVEETRGYSEMWAPLYQTTRRHSCINAKTSYCSRSETKFHTQTLFFSCQTPQPLRFPVGWLVRYTKIDLTVRDGSSSCSREGMCWMERVKGDREMRLEAQKAEPSVETDVMDPLQMYSWIQQKCNRTRHCHHSPEWHSRHALLRSALHEYSSSFYVTLQRPKPEAGHSTASSAKVENGQLYLHSPSLLRGKMFY